MRDLLTGTVLMLALACSPAWAITIDGDASEWDADYAFIDDPTDNTPFPAGGMPNGVEMKAYGAKIEDGEFRAFVRLAHTIDYYRQPSADATTIRKVFFSVYLDVDNSTTTEAWENQALRTTIANKWTDGAMNGVDINLEYSFEEGPYTSGVMGHRYWGAGDDLRNEGSSVNGWTGAPYDYSVPGLLPANAKWLCQDLGDAADGDVIEMRCSLTELAAEVLSYPDAAVLGNVIKVGVGVQGKDGQEYAPGGTGNVHIYYGYDLGYAFLIMQDFGDFDDDDVGVLGVDPDDIDALFAQDRTVSTRANLSMYDLDRNGRVESVHTVHGSYGQDDLDKLLDTIGAWRGDTDLDGDVDSVDFSNLALSWGTTAGKGWANGDNSGDGAVGRIDYTSMALTWGYGAGPTVPEPAMLSLLSLAGVAMLRRRR